MHHLNYGTDNHQAHELSLHTVAVFRYPSLETAILATQEFTN